MAEFWTTLLNGLSLGGIYALIALGYTMVYGIAKMLNFAHGDLIMVAAYTIVVAVGAHINPFIAILIAIVICVIVGLIMERFAYRPLKKASPLAVLITAVGVSYLLESLCLIIFKSNPRSLPDMNLSKTAITILTLAVAIVLMIALTLFINFTRVGKAMLAVSEDSKAANLMGVNSTRTVVLTFAIGSALAAVAGAFYLMKTGQAEYNMGSLPGIKAFTACVIGGIGSIPGAMIGGLILGLIEIICSSISGLSNFTIAIEFGILIAILLIKPTGILGRKRKEKV